MSTTFSNNLNIGFFDSKSTSSMTRLNLIQTRLLLLSLSASCIALCGSYRRLPLSVWRVLLSNPSPPPNPSRHYKHKNLSRLTSFAVDSACVTTPPFAQLLQSIADSSPQLERLSLAVPDVLHYIGFASLQTLRVLHLDCKDCNQELDIFPHLLCLEEFRTYRLRIPPAHTLQPDTGIPLLTTLKKLTCRGFNIEWMGGRTFTKLESLAVTWPHNDISGSRDLVKERGGVFLPALKEFSFEDYLLEPLKFFRSTPGVFEKLEVLNESWSKARGDSQLGLVWPTPATPQDFASTTGGFSLRPRHLHFDTIAHDAYFVGTLRHFSDVVRLEVIVGRPDVWGKKFFTSMIAKKVKGAPKWEAALCPALEDLDFVYATWYGAQPGDSDDEDVLPLNLRGSPRRG